MLSLICDFSWHIPFRTLCFICHSVNNCFMYHTVLLRATLYIVFQVPSAWKEETIQVHLSTSYWQMLPSFQWWQVCIFQTMKCLAWHQIGGMLSTHYWVFDQSFGSVVSCSLVLWLLISYLLVETMFYSYEAVTENTKIFPGMLMLVTSILTFWKAEEHTPLWDVHVLDQNYIAKSVLLRTHSLWYKLKDILLNAKHLEIL